MSGLKNIKIKGINNMDNNLITTFEALLNKVDRDGMDKLLAFIKKSDFYTAPASTRFHSCHEGGLLEHSMNVYNCLLAKKKNPIWAEKLAEIPDESLIISALLHDLCKTYFYGSELKNQKTCDEEKVNAANPRMVKSDSNGKFIWETVPKYVVDDKIPYGHGEKSVMMIEEYIRLTPAERYAIRWHMGWSEPKENYNTLGATFCKYPLALALHEADQEATYLLEKEE